jgi:hypothetical protein
MASLMDALGGNITADEWLALQQQGSQDPRSQFVGGMGDYLGMAQRQMYQIPGYEDVKPGYQWDDSLGGAKFAYGIDQDALDRQTKEANTQFTQGLQSGAAQRDIQKQQAQFSDPGSDVFFLAQQGVPPEVLAQLAEPGIDPAKFTAGLDKIAPMIPGMVDPDTGETTWHTTSNMQRLMAIVNHAAQQVGQGPENEQAMVEQTNRDRWAKLDPNMRAKEIVLRSQKPNENAVVTPPNEHGLSLTFRGPDAQATAARYMNRVKPPPAYYQAPKPPKGSTQDKGTHAEQIARGSVKAAQSTNRGLWEGLKWASGYDALKWLGSK